MSKAKIPVIPIQTQYIDIVELVHGDQPYRTITPEAFEELKTSISSDQEFFLRRPCLVNKIEGKLVVYAGNQKLDAAIALGWKQVPCIIHELSKEAMDKRMLKDNTHSGIFDMDFIEMTYDKEILTEAGFDIDLITSEDIEKPDDIVEQTPIDNKLYSFFNSEKIFVDSESDEFLQEDIKKYLDRTTTVFGYISNLRQRFEGKQII